jgi:hypothetical protein
MKTFYLSLCVLLTACNLPDVKIVYNAVVINNYTNLPVKDINVEFIQVAPSYMQKDKLITATTTNSVGVFQIKERIVTDKTYKIIVNNTLDCAEIDTQKVKYLYTTSGKASKKGNEWNVTMDTIFIAPAGSIRFSYNDSIFNKYNADALIVEAGNNRAVMGSSIAFPPAISSHPITGSVDYNLMHFTPNATYTFKFYTHTNGIVTWRATKNIFIKNGYTNNSMGCYNEQLENVAF